MGSFSDCKKCHRHISRYTIERITHPNNMEVVKDYYIKFCWGCGYFSIYPNDIDDFTTSILNNSMLIIELIGLKKLKPVL